MEKTRVSRTNVKSRLFIKAALCFILIFGLGMAMAQNLMAVEYSQVMSFGTYGTGTSTSTTVYFNTPFDIAVDSSGYIYVLDSGNNRVQKFDSTGKYVSKFGTYGTGTSTATTVYFNEPSGIAVNDSYIYVADSGNNRVQKFDKSGTYVSKFTGSTTQGVLSYPYRIAIDTSSYVYVTDDTRLQKFTSSGTYVKKYGTYNSPSGVAVGSDKWRYVIDYFNDNIKIFDDAGVLQYTAGSSGAGNGQLKNATGIAVNDLSTILYVADTGNSRIQILDYSGVYQSQFGTYGSGSGQFNSPTGIAVDSSENLYVVDSVNNRVQKFSPRYKISGYVKTSSGAALSGVTMTTSGGTTATTDSSGYYSFLSPFTWSGTITPSKSGYTFYPTSNSYSSGTTSDQAHDYTAYGATYTISGKVYDSSTYYGISGVTVTTSSGGYTTTDYSGYYSFTVSPGWSGTITPSKSGYTFTPKTYSYLSSDLWWEDYYGSSNPTSYTISGSVYDSSYNYMSGVTMTLSTGGTTTTDSSGSYSFTVSSGWSGTVTPSKSGYSFSPVNQSYSYVYSDQYSQYFVGSIPPSGYTIYGSVYDSSYNYMSGVTMTLSTGGTTTTDSYGSYSFTVNSGWSGTITPSKSGYTFAPISNSYSYVTSNQYSPYFVGNPSGYTISGYVYDASTYAYLSDVTMTTSSGSTTTTDSSGNYSFTVSSDWSGTITPSKSGYTFSPSSKSYSSVSYSYSYEAYSASCSGGTSFVTRTLPTTYTPGVKLTVALTATPPSGTTNYTVKDTPPAGWEVDPNTISSGGIFDTTAKNVRFIVMNGNSGTFTYDVTPPASETGDKTFSGTANINGTTNSVIGGQANISKGLSNHPADNNPADLQLTDSETNAYIHAWLVGATWTTGPNPIPASYAVRAGGLWLGGTDGRYKTDSTAGNAPYCWVNTTGTRSERDGTSSTAVRQMSSPYTAGKPMTVSIIVTFGTKNANPSYSLTDQVPSGWTASNFKSNGISDSTAQFVNGKVQFFFYDKLSRTVSYDVTPPAGESGTKTFSGTADFFNEAIPITGVSFISDTGGTGSNTPGDLNGSGGEPNLADAILGLQVLAGLNPPNVKVGADVNGDQKIGLPEVIYILQKVAGLRPSGT